MKADLFFDALNDIHDRYVTEALTYRASSKRILRPILRGLAAACLAVIIGFSTILAISAEAREIVFGWIRDQANHFTYYTYEESPTEPGEVVQSAVYEMTLIPEGYALFDHYSRPGYTSDVYADADGRLLNFIYRSNKDGLAGFNTENTTMYTAQVRGCDADIFMANDPTAVGSAIIWEENNILFSISGFFDMNTLIELAESVAVRPKEYVLGYIPEGYTLLDMEPLPDHYGSSYADYDSGNVLHFYYLRGDDEWLSAIFHENATYQTVTVRGVEADLYLPNDPTEDGAVLVWFEDEYMMSIQGFFSEDEIIQLAESITEVPYSPEPTWQSTYGDQQGK